MDVLRPLGIILAFGFAGEFLSRLLPLGMPASVWGLMLMLAALGFKALKPEDLGKTGEYLSANMAFFFLPAAATVLENAALIRGAVVKLLAIIVISSAVTFFVSYGTVRLLRRILGKR
ncbi:MAG: CidA/LrgA family protein [Treponema sp.]|jgi:holin-like protein|nr:CidA/LrgA family protein [Treponema sp.]